MLSAAQAGAHLPELYGRDYVLEPAPAAVPAPGTGDDALDRARKLDALEADLAEQVARAGPYAAQLTDPLLQVGALRADTGNAVAALRHYEQALHVLRVNNGLLHPAQLPLLRTLADLYRRIGDWRSGQLAWRYAYRIHGMGEMAVTDETLADALAYFTYARDAYIAPGAAGDDSLFVQAYRDNEQLFERLSNEGNEDGSAAALQAVGVSFLRNLYVLLGTDLSGYAARGPGGAGFASGSRMLTLQELGLGKGLEILDRLLDAAPAAPEQARLRLRRGNWLQWNGKWRSARDEYAAIFPLLDDSPASMALREQLSMPAVLPEDAALWRSLQRADTPVRGVFAADYSVSERGNCTRIEVRAEADAKPALAGRLRRMLGDSHFRPALRDAVLTEVRVEGRRYRLID